jgi:hypothetical protein
METLVWIDADGEEYNITRMSEVQADGTFVGAFADSVGGVFHLRDCRTA